MKRKALLSLNMETYSIWHLISFINNSKLYKKDPIKDIRWSAAGL